MCPGELPLVLGAATHSSILARGVLASIYKSLLPVARATNGLCGECILSVSSNRCCRTAAIHAGGHTAAFFRSVGLPSHVPRGLYEPGCSAGECLGSQLFHANSSQVRQIAHGLFRAHGIPTFTPRGPTFDVVKWADFFNASGVVILASPAYDKVQQARGIIDYSERRYGRDSSHGCRVETWNQRQWHIRSVPEITAESPCSKHHGQLLRNRMRPPPAPTAL